MPLNDCEISLNLTWSEIYISSSATWKTKFPIADTKPYGVLSFENKTDRKAHTKYYIPRVEIKDYSVIIDERNFFDQPVKNDLKTYDSIRKDCNWSRRWLNTCLFTILSLSQGTLKTNCNIFM